MKGSQEMEKDGYQVSRKIYFLELSLSKGNIQSQLEINVSLFKLKYPITYLNFRAVLFLGRKSQTVHTLIANTR